MNHEAKSGLLYKDECYRIQGAIFEVYKEIGAGFFESVYQECLEKELAWRNIPFQAQVDVRINYKGQILNQYFRADLICYDSIILELKACKAIDPIHRAQLINYLRATGTKLGLLVNFSACPKVEIERIVL
jgi:GxxExxY protein